MNKANETVQNNKMGKYMTDLGNNGHLTISYTYNAQKGLM